MKCPWCKGSLESYHSGVKCAKCFVYFERNAWWSVGCDEAHAHTQKCLFEREIPKSKKAAKVRS